MNDIRWIHPSLRDGRHWGIEPSVETLGYFQNSLRETEIPWPKCPNSKLRHGRSSAEWRLGFLPDPFRNLVGNFGLSFPRQSAYSPMTRQYPAQRRSARSRPRVPTSGICTEAIVTKSLRA